MGGNGSKSISGETLARGEHQHSEVLERFRDKLQAFISDDHPLEPDLLEPRVGSSHGLDPRADISAPTLGDQIEVCEVRLALDSNGSHFGEAVDDGGRRDSIAVADEDSPAAPAVDLVPGLADEGDRTTVLVALDEGEHMLQHLLGEGVGYSGPHVQRNITQNAIVPEGR